MKLKLNLLISSLIVLFAVPDASAVQSLTTLETVASKDVLAIAWIDLETVQLKDCLAWAADQGIVDSQTENKFATNTRMAQAVIDAATEAGVDHVFALIHQEDLLFRGPPVIVFSVSDVEKIDETFEALQGILVLLQQPDFKLEVWNGTILGGTEQQIARVKAEPVIERPRLVKAWKKFGGHNAGAMLVGSLDTRRVVREMFPKLDAPLENITGKIIADDVDSIGIVVGLPKEVAGKLIVQTTDDDTANLLKDATEVALGLLASGKSEFSDLVPPAVRSAISILKPQIEANELVIDLKPVLDDQAKLLDMLEPMVGKSSESTPQ